MGSSLSSTILILKSTTKLFALGSSLFFKRWTYITITITFDYIILPFFINPNNLIYLDTDSKLTLIDRVWLEKKPFLQTISIILVFLKVGSISIFKYKSRNFAFITIYIPSLDRKVSKVYAMINYVLYLMDKSKINILVSNNIICIKDFTINFFSTPAYIYNYNEKIDISGKHYFKILKCRIPVNNSTFMPPQSEALITFQYIYLLESCNFLFYPFLQ